MDSFMGFVPTAAATILGTSSFTSAVQAGRPATAAPAGGLPCRCRAPAKSTISMASMEERMAAISSSSSPSYSSSSSGEPTMEERMAAIAASAQRLKEEAQAARTCQGRRRPSSPSVSSGMPYAPPAGSSSSSSSSSSPSYSSSSSGEPTMEERMAAIAASAQRLKEEAQAANGRRQGRSTSFVPLGRRRRHLAV
eukprot:TRINITY_DN5_c0_g1_i6.p2 TRINITY_DN5_c0_g1~~TRINITY_DN5_c0_g1_i6.p2  ORF type:complete len:195 (+),score=47.50 TRINITY_DN5_c0_g1_i6:324-908(+)